MIALLPFAALLSAEPALRAAVIIGVNDSFDATQPRLRYADDDAARWFELLEPELDRVELLTVLDVESQRLFPAAAAIAKVPDRATLWGALERIQRAAEETRKTGGTSELYFIYTGHGRLEAGEGQVRLKDGLLARADLIERVLAPAHHDRVHLVIDACNAYHLVHARGDVEVTRALDLAFERFVDASSLDPYPHVGAVLATSGPGASHEWSRYQGGLFSHEVRSAIAGAADVDGDGRIDYGEAGAFLAAANFEIPSLRGRPKVFVRAPAIDRAAPLFAPAGARPEVELPAWATGHFYLEDDRGLRYAELHKGEGYVAVVRLVEGRRYALVTADGGARAELDLDHGRARPDLPLAAVPVLAIERGGEAPPGVFGHPFGPSFVLGFRAQLDAVPELSAPILAATPAPHLAGHATKLAVFALALAVWQTGEARASHAVYESTLNADERNRAAGDVRAAEARAIGLGIAAGVSALGAAAIWLFAGE